MFFFVSGGDWASEKLSGRVQFRRSFAQTASALKF